MIPKFFEKLVRESQTPDDVQTSPIQFDGPIDLLIDDAQVLTFDASGTQIARGAIAVADGRIVALGEANAMAQLRNRATQIISAAGRIAMPGLINTHCHAGDSLFRGLVEGLPLEPWLEKLWVAESATLNLETIELGSQLGYAENLLCGVTTVMDMFWEPTALLDAAHKTGIRVATGGIFFDPPGIDGLRSDERDGVARAFFDTYKDHPSLIPTVCAHGAYTVSPENLQVALKVQQDYDTLLTIHAAETSVEQKTIQDQYGRSVIRHLDYLGLLGSRTVLAHCVHLDDEEIDILARTGASVSHNPASNLKLGSGIARIPQLLEKGVRVALGTDGAVSGNDLDMWKSIRLAAVLHNGHAQNALAIRADQALLMATIEGARALGIADQTGSLEVGKRADIVLLNPRQVHSVPMFDPISYLAYSASHSDVEDVFVGGRQVVKSRRLTMIDLDDILDRVSAMVPAIRVTLERSNQHG